VLTGARAVAKRRPNRGEERRCLELGTRSKEGMRELGRGGNTTVRAGGARRLLLGPREHRGGVAEVVTADVNGFKAIEGRARLRRVKEGP
jgi:hypothetical protein